MNVKKVITQLAEKFPDRTILKNQEERPTEIICETEPTRDHSDFSVAIAIIDQSIAHVHKKSTEEYEVLKGELTLTINGIRHALTEGMSYTIHPGEIHSASGRETWVKTTSTPGWTPQDHILIPKE